MKLIRHRNSPRGIWWVGMGSGLGGVARWLTGEAAIHWLGASFPWGTLSVNLAGSAAIGALAALIAPDGRWRFSPEKRLFLMVGVCGGFTSFSFFSLQTWQLMEAGRVPEAVLYSTATLFGGALAASLGYLSLAKR